MVENRLLNQLPCIFFLDYDRLKIGGLIFTVLLVIGAFLLLFRKFHFLLLDLALMSRLLFFVFFFIFSHLSDPHLLNFLT